MSRQPWYKEGHKPQRIATCTECGRTFRDKRTADKALLGAIFGQVLCPECEAKAKGYVCVACNKMIEEDKEVMFEGRPHHPRCLAAYLGVEA